MYSVSPYVIVCVALMVVPLVTSSPRHKMAANIKQAETGFIHDVIPVTSQRLDKRVIHGNDAKPGSHPWIVSIVFNSKRYCDKIIPRRDEDVDCSEDHEDSFERTCGGTLIDESWVLTAAHCVETIYHRVFFDSLRIVAGAHDFSCVSGREQMLEVDDIIIHPKYMSDEEEHDIALIKLKNRVKTSEYVKIAILSKNDDAFVNTNCGVAGWGVTDGYDEDSVPDVLQEANATVISNKECQVYADIFEEKIHPGHVCYLDKYSNSPSATCYGDSGGPLMCGAGHDVLVGVTSWDFAGNCHQVIPAIYTRVSYYLDFILRNTGIEIGKF